MNETPDYPPRDAWIAKVTFALADIPSLLGQQFAGDWLTIEQETIPLFDRATYVNDDNAGYDLSTYPAGMFEGLHTLGMIWPLVESGFQIMDTSAMGLVYGFDNVRFTSPVHANQRLRARGVVSQVKERGDGYLVLVSVIVDIDGQDKPAYVAEWWVFYQPTDILDLRPPEATVARGDHDH